jgi:formylglycine-generating enzyme required for sulfatase activity
MSLRSPSQPIGPSLATLLVLSLVLVAGGASGAAPATRCPDGMLPLEGGRFRPGDGGPALATAPFCLDVTEVTADHYGACVLRGDCVASEGLSCSQAATFDHQGRGDHPLNCVTWYEAERFCRAHGKRLPTEAEWEWAARGRTRARTYPWGEEPPAGQACWDGPGSALGAGARSTPCPVGAHPAGASPDGLQDLAGNVREWTATEVDRHRIVRGGSWGDSHPDFLAAGFRGQVFPEVRGELVGFRCATEPGTGRARSARLDRSP